MKSRKSFLLRIGPALYDSIEAWAQQELRSVNGQIEYILKEAVQKHGRQTETTVDKNVDENKVEQDNIGA